MQGLYKKTPILNLNLPAKTLQEDTPLELEITCNDSIQEDTPLKLEITCKDLIQEDTPLKLEITCNDYTRRHPF